MCGIAGISLTRHHSIDVVLLVKLFIAGLAERGEDACGYAYRCVDGTVEVVKHAVPPHQFLSSTTIEIPPDVTEILVHVRDHTKGRPSIEGNNHPIVHGAVCGVHNGIIQNDDDLFEEHGRERALPGMSVDSEAIFMLLDLTGDTLESFRQLIGSYSVAWLDTRQPDAMFAARGRGRPLMVADGDGIAMVASTRHALRFARHRLGLIGPVRTVPHGALLTLRDGTIDDATRFAVTDFTEQEATRYPVSLPHAREARRMADRHLRELRAAAPEQGDDESLPSRTGGG